MKKTIKNMGVLLLAACISACSSLVDLNSEQAPERVYLLKPYLLQDAGNNRLRQKEISISISAAPGLDSDKILILESDAHLNHYASARWPDHSTEIFAFLFRNTLESSGHYAKVHTQSLQKAERLNLEIKELYTLNSSTTTAESVRVSLRGNLDCAGDSKPIKLLSTIDIQQEKLSEIVSAYQAAVNEISLQLLEQVSTCQ